MLQYIFIIADKVTIIVKISAFSKCLITRANNQMLLGISSTQNTRTCTISAFPQILCKFFIRLEVHFNTRCHLTNNFEFQSGICHI